MCTYIHMHTHVKSEPPEANPQTKSDVMQYAYGTLGQLIRGFEQVEAKRVAVQLW